VSLGAAAPASPKRESATRGEPIDMSAVLQLHARPPAPAAAAVARLALRQYRSVSLEARVAAASPHELVLMLFERLCLLLRDARAAAGADPARRLRATERALAIVDGLDSTLDDSRGGDVARSLHEAYATLRDRIAQGNALALSEAIAAADELAAAWRAIGRRDGE
jgi:flagellar protein FliS